MGIFNVVVKGDLDEVIEEIETRPDLEFYNARIRDGAVTGFIRGEDIDLNYMNTWFLNGEARPPFRPGTLLHYSEAPRLREVGETLA